MRIFNGGKLMEVNLNIEGKDKTGYSLRINDKYIYYYELRRFVDEKTCLKILDFIKSNFKKKFVIIFGNCQTEMIIKYLMNHTIFCEEYFFIILPAVYTYNDTSIKYLDEDFWQFCDLFISHRVSENNRFGVKLSTKRLSNNLSEKSKIVWIPNIYFDGYFPQYVKNTHNVNTEKDLAGWFPYGDKYVDEYMELNKKPDINCLIDKLSNENFILKQDIMDHVWHSISELEKRDWLCDVHILDFVVDNFSYKQLFYSNNHPIAIALIELTKRILKFIGIDKGIFLNDFQLINPYNHYFSLIGQGMPIYPCVIKALNLKEYENEIYANAYLWNFKGNFQEYIKTYIKYCWSNKLNN